MLFLDQQQKSLAAMGERLRSARIARGDTQMKFAQRLAVSVPTLRAMEQGDPHVQVGTWITGLWVLDRLSDLDEVLRDQGSLFARADAEAQSAKARRRRASRSRG